MFKLLSKNKTLSLIIILASVLRLWGLSGNPVHLTNDEAALGYNAYSILKTGHDEHGAFLPVVFESFGDWKPGLYIYATVPFVAIFGLNEFSTRFAGALSGIIAILLIYKIAELLFKEKRIALFCALFLAISPWHIHFSRGGWEANLGLTLVLAGIYFFQKGISENGKYIILSTLSFALTLWAYQGAKLSSALVVFTLLILYWKEILKINKKYILFSAVAGALLAFPIFQSFSQGKTGRLEVYSVFSYPRNEETVNDILFQNGETKNSLEYILYHSEKLNFLRGVLSRYYNHFSSRFLFFEGDWQSFRHSIPNVGQILVLDIVFLVAGLIFLSRNYKNRSVIFILLWLVLTPLPAALSRDDVHAVRSLNMVIPLSMLLGIGAYQISLFKKRAWFFPAMVLFTLLYLANYFYYLDAYWVHGPKKFASYWQYGYKQMVEAVTPLESKYPEIVIKQDYSQPYIFFLFYQKYDPAKYQKISNEVFTPSKYGDVGLVSKLDNVTFRDINWRDDRGAVGKIIISDPIKVPIVDSSDPKDFKVINEIKYPDGNIAFRFIEPLH